MRILSIYYTHKPGGLCKRLYQLLRAAQSQGHSITHLCLNPELLPKDLQSTAQKIPFPSQARQGLLFWFFFTTWTPLYACWIARQKKIDLFLSFQAYYSALFLFAKVILRKPTILFLRSLVFQINRLKKIPQPILFCADFLEEIGVQSASEIVYMTEYMRSEIHKFAGERKNTREHILPNNLPDIQKKTEISREKLLWRAQLPQELAHNSLWALCSGVLDERKNIDLILLALKQENRDCLHLFIAGEGPLRSELEKKSKELGLTQVHFLGWRDDVVEWVQEADLFLHPSLHEGVSNSLLEALALQKTVLLSDIPEHRELDFPLDSYFDHKNPLALQALLERCIKDTEFRLRLREKQISVCQRFQFPWDEKALVILSNALSCAGRPS